jgi:hypothetical protein
VVNTEVERKREDLECHRFSRPRPDRKENLLKEIDSSSTELSDEHIDHAQGLLRQEYPEIGGFLSISALTATQCNELTPLDSKFIQVLHLPKKQHWICVSNINRASDSELLIYDSMSSRKPSLPFSLQEKMAALMRPKHDIRLIWLDVKQQDNSVDCGVYAIAAAVALCSGQAPEKCDWNTTGMRQHLKRCFNDDKITPFPVIGHTRKPASPDTETVHLYCYCRLPVKPNDDSLWECSCCGGRYHKQCIGSKHDLPIDEPFTCSNCKTQIMKT